MRKEIKKKQEKIGNEKDDHDGQRKALFRRECPTAGPGDSRAMKDGGDNERDGRQP